MMTKMLMRPPEKMSYLSAPDGDGAFTFHMVQFKRKRFIELPKLIFFAHDVSV